MIDYSVCYHPTAQPRTNPLIGATAGETCQAVAEALGALRCVEIAALDEAGAAGFEALLSSCAAALAAGAALEDTLGFWLSGSRAERLRELARRDGVSVDQALDQALDLLAASAPAPESLADTRARYERVRDLAQSWLDALDAPTGEAGEVSHDQ